MPKLWAMGLRKALIIPDCHRPYHSVRAYNLMLEIASSVSIDEIVLLGDYADFYHVSRHKKDPRVQDSIAKEIESVNQGLDELDKLFPRAKKVYLEGNHEIRLESYLIERCPELFGLTEVSALFKIKERGYHWAGFGRHQSYHVLGSDLVAFHRPKASQVHTHIQKTHVSSVFGDIHKIVQSHAVALDGKHLVAYCPGWLGEVRHRVFDYMPTTPQWQLGFSFVSVEDSSKQFHHEIIEIKNNKALYNGKIFKG